MSTGVPRGFLGISEPAWQVLLAGGVVALWFLVVLTGTAQADDCLEYVKNPKNFIAIPKGLLEDCMRTGTVQALVTGAIAGVSGAAIAAAVGKAIQDAAAQAGPGPHVVPDTGGKDATAAVGGEPGVPPEAPPPQQTRENTPDACRTLFDQYQAALQEAHGQSQALQVVKRGYNEAFSNHQNNLAKLTVQLGMDAADMASAGAAGVKGGRGIARAVAHAPEALKELITKAVARSGHLQTMITGFIEDIAGLMAKGSRFASAADEAGRLGAKAEAKIADLVKEAAHLEGQIGKYDVLVRFARSADATLLERNAASRSVLAAEEALRDANKNHQRILNRKKALEDWAAAERMNIANEDARAFAKKHEELGNARNKLQALQAQQAQAARAAHGEWQAKMSELSAVKKELDEARAASAHLQKAKTEKLVAEQEVRRAAVVRSEAETRLQHADAELAAFDAAAKEAEAAKAAVRQLESEAEALAKRIEVAEARFAEGKAKLERATGLEQEAATLESAKAGLEEKRAALEKASADRQAFGAGPELAQYQADLKRVTAAEEAANQRWSEALDRHKQAQADVHTFQNKELNDEFERLGLDTEDQVGSFDQLPPARQQELRARATALDQAVAVAKAELDEAITARQQARANAQPARADVESRYAKVLEKRDELETNWNLARIEEGEARDVLWQQGWETTDGATRRINDLKGEARQFRQEGEVATSADNPEGPAALKSEQTRLKSEITTKQYEAASKHQEGTRSRFEQKVAAAKGDADQAIKVHSDAENKLAAANKDLEAADLSGTGEPLGSLHQLEGIQARYNRLVQEQEALRVKYEELKSAGNLPEAAPLKQRIDELEAELANWKDPDWETEAAKRSPQKYNEWKSEQGGLDRIAESQAQIDGLDAKVKELQSHLATVEQKMNEQRGQAGGKSTEELETERDSLKSQLATKQSELQVAKEEQKAHEQAKAAAEADKKKNDAEIKEKEAQKRQAEEEKRKADEEIARLKYMQEHPVAPPTDASGLGPKLGDQWTPYHGSGAESIAQKSHAARQKFDQMMDAITPDFLTAPFRWAGNKAGEVFRWAFGGQSPEEVAAIIKRGDERVKQWSKWLADAEAHHDQALQRAKDLKRDLAACVARNK